MPKNIFGFAGYSGSGKTTLIEQLIPRFAEAGLAVSLIKHAHHDFDIDVPATVPSLFRKRLCWSPAEMDHAPLSPAGT